METDFRAVDPKYDQDYGNGVTDAEYESLFSFLKSKKIKTVLDLAGGSGKLAIMLNERGYDVTLFDIAENMISRAVASGFPSEKAIAADFFNYKFKKKFDLVILKSAMHEIPKKQQAEIHRRISETVKKGGWYIDWDVHQSDSKAANWLKEWANLKDATAGLNTLVKNRFFYTESQIKQSLSKAGFKDIETIHRFFYTLSIQKFEEIYWHGDKEKTKTFVAKTKELLKSKPETIKDESPKPENVTLKFEAVIIAARKP